MLNVRERNGNGKGRNGKSEGRNGMETNEWPLIRGFTIAHTHSHTWIQIVFCFCQHTLRVFYFWVLFFFRRIMMEVWMLNIPACLLINAKLFHDCYTHLFFPFLSVRSTF